VYDTKYNTARTAATTASTAATTAQQVLIGLAIPIVLARENYRDGESDQYLLGGRGGGAGGRGGGPGGIVFCVIHEM